MVQIWGILLVISLALCTAIRADRPLPQSRTAARFGENDIPSSEDLASHIVEALPHYRDGAPMSKDEIAEQISAYLDLKGGNLGPIWTNHTNTEKDDNVKQHYHSRRRARQRRRLQWPGGARRWFDTDAQARDDQLVSFAENTVQTEYCDDPLASNNGASAPCTYDCEDLKAAYFPPTLAVRCFVFDDASDPMLQWPEVGGQNQQLLNLRQQYFELHTYVDNAIPGPMSPISFVVGEGRVCRNVTIVSTTMGQTASLEGTTSIETEVACLLDGEHHYNHTIPDDHTVEIVGYAQSGIHNGPGGRTSFVVGMCTDILIKVTTTSVGTNAAEWQLDDGGHNGPWTWSTPSELGTFVQETCMFDNEFTISRSDDDGWAGSIEIVGFIHYHNTITIPNDESWIIQGRVDSSTGLPVKLDARLKSGTDTDRSHANIILRHLRLSGQNAPVETNSLIRTGLIGFGNVKTNGYGGAFEYDGGGLDASMPAKIAFVDVVFDHNSATSSCGAVLIDSRGAQPARVPYTHASHSQRWDSSIEFTMERVTFFRNWARNLGGALCINNPWPATIIATHTDFMHNEAMIIPHDAYGWDPHHWKQEYYADPGTETRPREGTFSMTYTDTLHDGGWAEAGLFSYMCSSLYKITGGPDEPNALWNITMVRHEFRNARAFTTSYIAAYVNPPLPDNQLHLDAHWVDLEVTDTGSISTGNNDENIYMIFMQGVGSTRITGSRFVENGKPTSSGSGGLWAAPPAAGGSVVPTLHFHGSEWVGNKAGIGPAVYVDPGQIEIIFSQCLFRDNIAYKSAGAISVQGGERTSLAISSSIFQSNSVQPSVTGQLLDVPVLVHTGNSGLGTGDPGSPDFYFAPIWRIDDGPVYGISYELCERAKQGSLAANIEGMAEFWPSHIPCANVTYYGPERIYSHVISLAEGPHVLHTGVFVKSSTKSMGWMQGWIELPSVIGPLFPTPIDTRGDEDGRQPGCVYTPGCAVSWIPECCPVDMPIWEEHAVHISRGNGGAASFSGPMHILIRDSEFTDNRASVGSSLSISAASQVTITNTTIAAPEDSSVAAVSTVGTTVQRCLDNPCATGSSCRFQQYSTFCDACLINEVGNGVACISCGPGQQPDTLQVECVPCLSGQISTIGLCAPCPPNHEPNQGSTVCIPCQAGTSRAQGDAACGACEEGKYSNQGSGCLQCSPGTSPSEARDGCVGCPSGTHSVDGLECTTCPSGKQPDANNAKCDACHDFGPNAFSSDGVECRDCPARHRPSYDRSHCFCQTDTYSAIELGLIHCSGESFGSTVVDEDECAVCPPCMDCTVPGVTKLKSGWAFFGEKGEAYRCPGSNKFEACPPLLLNGTTAMDVSTCAKGYDGPVCGNCETEYNHLKTGTPCSACDDGVINIPLMFALLLAGIVFAAVGISGGLNTLSDYGILTDLRIIVGFYQILGQAGTVLDLTFPYPIPELVDLVKLLFLDVRRVVRLDCWEMGGFGGKLVTNLVAVPATIGGVCILIYIAQRRTLRELIAAGASDESGLHVLQVEFKHRLMVGIFLVYPTICTTLFRVPHCKTYGLHSFHEEDYRVDCSTTQFHVVTAFAVAMILLIPIGVPAAFMYFMWRAKNRLGTVNENQLGGAKLAAGDAADESDVFGFLIRDYKAEFYYYEIVAYSRKLMLGGVSVVMGRGTMAQTYFVICVEAGYLMHHVRTFPFVQYKHNVIEAVGHTALMLLYTVSLILRNEHSEDWGSEWFPKTGYAWFIVFVFAIALPAPTIWFHYKDKNVGYSLEDEHEFDNPLAPGLDVIAPPTDQPTFSSSARANQAKLLREANKAQTVIQKQRVQIQQLQNEMQQLRVARTGELATARAKGMAIGNDTDDRTDLTTTVQTEEAIVKGLVADEALSAETRESAKKALDVLATSKIQSLEAQFVTQQTKSQQKLELAKKKQATTVSKEMSQWLTRHRLVMYTDLVARVAGADASPTDLQYLTESDIQEICDTMTNLEKHRLQSALQDVSVPESEPEPELEQ